MTVHETAPMGRDLLRDKVFADAWLEVYAAEPVPATILDCFAGSGTVGMVAQSLSRRAVLIDLNPDYIKQQLRRNRDVPLGLAG